jgi:hypothetical protein
VSKQTEGWSLLRSDLYEDDLVTHGEDCPAELNIREGHVRNWCTRPLGHTGQHYSFSPEYEILWPVNPEE